ncbi:MAG: ubiquinol-cytochrome c reductase iron-sulfur subunit [Candidatus Aminicenantales bacterium]
MESDKREQPRFPSSGSRRSFLGALLGLASAFVGALLAVPVLRYIFYPVTAKSGDSDWADGGSVTVFSQLEAPLLRTLELKQRDGWREIASQPVVYIIRAGGQLKALSAICPHLGCTVPWDPGRNEFVCPCHGGTFSADGTHLSGPPRRSLDSLETKVAGGKLMVKYQYFRPDVADKEVIR